MLGLPCLTSTKIQESLILYSIHIQITKFLCQTQHISLYLDWACQLYVCIITYKYQKLINFCSKYRVFLIRNQQYWLYQKILLVAFKRKHFANLGIYSNYNQLILLYDLEYVLQLYLYLKRQFLQADMESQDSKNIEKLVLERNSEFKKAYSKCNTLNSFSLKLDTAFGINSNPICNQLQVVGEKYVVFMIGSILVIKDLIEKTEQFYSFPGRFNNVTALYGVSKEQKQKQKSKQLDKNQKPLYLPNVFPIKIYLAESSQNQDKIANVVYLKPYKNKLRVMSTGMKGNIKQMTVDRTKKMCACLIQSVQSLCVIIFNYRKQKLLTCTNLKMASIQNISIHPVRQKSLILMGRNYLRMWELHSQQEILKQQQQLVPLKTEKQNRFYDYSWQMNQKNPILFVLTNKNTILLIQNDTLVHTINLMDHEELFSIRATKKGFCVGGSNKSLSIYQLDKTFNPNLIIGGSSKQTQKTFKGQNNKQDQASFGEQSQEKIVRIHSSTSDGIFTVATTNQIGAFNFYYLNTLRIDADISSLDQFFASGFHNKKINCLSRSVTKQLLASCSQDNTVKIWNFFDAEGYQKKGLLSHKFNQQPLSVSMHPSGLFLAVSFSSLFKVFAIVNNTLQVLKEIQIPNCKIIKYSHGGHFLAVNQKQHIFIYDSIYYETLHLFSLSNHVQDLVIANDDTQIVATCTSGYVYCFSLYDSLHYKQYQNKKGYEHKQSTTYTCIGYDNKLNSFSTEKEKNQKALTQRSDKLDTNLFVGCTTQKYFVLFKNKCKDLVAQFPIIDCHVTSLLICSIQGLMIIGTSKGALRVYNWPLTQKMLELETVVIGGVKKVKIKQPQYVEINAHSFPVVAMSCSHDETYLFTGSEDGTILCFSLASLLEKQKRDAYCLIKPEDRKRIAQSANDLYLQKVERIEQKNETIQKLKFQILRSEKKLKLEKEKLEIIYRQKMDNLKKQYKITLQTNKKIKQSYIQNATKEYNELSEKLKNEKRKYEEEIEALRKNHKQKIQYEVKRNENLKKQIQDLQNRHTQELERMKEEHKLKMKKTKFQFYEKCQKLQIKYSNFLNESKKHSEEFRIQLEKKEKENDDQIEEEIKVKREQIAKVKAINAELEAKNKKLEQQYKNLKREDEEKQQQFQKLFKEHNDIRFENLKSDQDILKMQHQLLERLQVIQSKEETCKNARYQQTTLENFRYMLDSKIQSLEQKKMEMIQKIKSRESDLKNMFNELIKESEQNEKKSFELKQLNTQIQVLEAEIKKAEEEIDQNENKFKYFKTQVSSIANSTQDVRTIGKKLKKLVDDCQNETKDLNENQQDTNDKSDSLKEVNDELGRQAKWMEKKLKMVKDIAENYKQMREQNINGVLAQNTKLIEECNKLRNLNQQYKRNIQQYQKQLAQLLRKKEKSTILKREQDNLNLKGINKKLKQNEIKITDQHQKLQNISEEIKDLLRHKSQSKFPNVKSKLK